MVRKASRFTELSDESLECRQWRHKWDHVETLVEVWRGRSMKRAAQTLFMTLFCERCGATRFDRFTYTRPRQLLTRQYVHTDDYLVKDRKSWGESGTFNQNVRDELIDRLVASGVRRQEAV